MGRIDRMAALPDGPLQRQISHRSFDAAPAAGTPPQDFTAHAHGARITEAFGDITNRDIFPFFASNQRKRNLCALN